MGTEIPCAPPLMGATHRKRDGFVIIEPPPLAWDPCPRPASRSAVYAPCETGVNPVRRRCRGPTYDVRRGVAPAFEPGLRRLLLEVASGARPVAGGVLWCGFVQPGCTQRQIRRRLPRLGTRPRPSISLNATVGGKERHNVHSMPGEGRFLRSMQDRGRPYGHSPAAKRDLGEPPSARYVARPTSA